MMNVSGRTERRDMESSFQSFIGRGRVPVVCSVQMHPVGEGAQHLAPCPLPGKVVMGGSPEEGRQDGDRCHQENQGNNGDGEFKKERFHGNLPAAVVRVSQNLLQGTCQS
jgi:hypothetical protein